MNNTKFFLLICAMLFISLNTSLIYAEERVTPAPAAQQVEPQAQAETDFKWAWGEVVGLDTDKKEITIKYLDYETDKEEEMKISVDDKTVYEEVKSFSDIALTDTISVDYILDKNSKNLARNIYVEKTLDTKEAIEEGTVEKTKEGIEEKTGEKL